MPHKKFVRENHRTNEFEHAKIIAIVDREGVIKGYDWTLTQRACDFFADPEDKKKYEAITVKPVACESMAELQEKFRVAEEFLRWGATLAGPKAQKSMKAIAEGRCSAEWSWHVDDNGMIGDVNMRPDTPKPHGCKPSPHARGIGVYRADLKVVKEDLKEAEYKIGDRIQLCAINRIGYEKSVGFVNGKKIELPPRDFWVTIQAKRTEMWVRDDRVLGDDEDHFFQDELVGMDGDGGDLIEFNPKHVIQHLPAKRVKDMTPVERAKWFTSGSDSDSSDSDSDSDSDVDPELKIRLPYRTTIYGPSRPRMTNVLGKILEKIKLMQMREPLGDPASRGFLEQFAFKLGQQSDADLPESASKLEQSAAAAPEPVEAAEQAVAPPECIVPPRAPRAPRRRARPAQ